MFPVMLSIRTICHILLLQYELHLYDISKYVIIFMVQFGPQGMMLQLWCKTSDMLCYTHNKPLVYF